MSSLPYARYEPPSSKIVQTPNLVPDDEPKRKKVKIKHKRVEDEENETEDNTKHKSLLSKREKSKRKAEKLLQITSAAAESELEEDKNQEEPPELHPLQPLPQPKPAAESINLPPLSSLPPWLASPIRVSSKTKADFSDFGIPSATIDSLRAGGFTGAFAVQAAVLPLLIPKSPAQPWIRSPKPGDVLVSAATGSGKTLAYALPMVADLSQTTVPHIRGLIVVPTRELVSQTRFVCEMCAKAYSAAGRRQIRIGTAVGSQNLKSERVTLMKEELVYRPEEYKQRARRLKIQRGSNQLPWWWWDDRADNDSSEPDVLHDLPQRDPGDEDYDPFDDKERLALSTLPFNVPTYTSNVDILVCTPGRLVEHIKSTEGFSLDHLKWLVIDEADKLLDQSFQQWVPILMSKLPNRGHQDNVIKVLLSATLTRDVGLLNELKAELKLYKPKLVVLESSENAQPTQDPSSGAIFRLPRTLHESATKVENDAEKPLYLLRILKQSKSSPLDLAATTGANTSSRSLIFTNSAEAAMRLARLISILEPSIKSKIGVLTKAVRRSAYQSILESFNKGDITVLVVSDLAARGMDLPNLNVVINYDMPKSVDSYVHRVGRTARSDKEGHAWTLFSSKEGRWFWQEIARSSTIERSGEVVRVNIPGSSFSETEKSLYESALATLGAEAGTT